MFSYFLIINFFSELKIITILYLIFIKKVNFIYIKNFFNY